jgi:CheY-like chemotaxis protein/HPt (histidine-containing phosphotransfer) domain-containing protein
MGGEVAMQSAPGLGTTLLLTVPLAVADAGEVEAATGAIGAGRLVPKRPKPSRDVAEREGSLVLLAEDHPINRRVLVHQLGIIGFHVDSAEDGRKAFELFAKGRYGLVLTDLNMPLMDGFELAGAIRREEAGTGRSRTPILALSANVMAGEAEKCAAVGMDDFAAKPTSMLVLAEKLRRWMPHVEWPDMADPSFDGPSGAEASSGPEDAIIDHAALYELTGGDDDLAASILVDYIDSSGPDLAALRRALVVASADDVRRHAHRIKGASRTVGAGQVAALAERLETAASTAVDDWQTLRSTADDLELAVARVAKVVTTPSPASG